LPIAPRSLDTDIVNKGAGSYYCALVELPNGEPRQKNRFGSNLLLQKHLDSDILRFQSITGTRQRHRYFFLYSVSRNNPV